MLTVSVYPSADSALGAYQYDIQAGTAGQVATIISRKQAVKGLGDQATALFETSSGNPQVDVCARSGNAEIDMSFSDLVALDPALSQTQLLAADVAMIRDVLARLPVKR